jgi:molybdopterin synthase sulfur carrier subunit
VRLFTVLRILAGEREVILEAPDVDELIKLLVKRFDSEFQRMLLEEDGSLKHYFHVLVNGRHIRLLDGINTSLKEGDVVAIFPPLGGGYCRS